LILNFNKICNMLSLCFISMKVRMNWNDPFYILSEVFKFDIIYWIKEWISKNGGVLVWDALQNGGVLMGYVFWWGTFWWCTFLMGYSFDGVHFDGVHFWWGTFLKGYVFDGVLINGVRFDGVHLMGYVLTIWQFDLLPIKDIYWIYRQHWRIIFSSPCQRQYELLPSLGVRHPLTFRILIFSSETP